MTAKKNLPDARCAACGAAFTCGIEAGQDACWCASLPALEPVPDRSCLCRACFEEELGLARPPLSKE